jgi:Bacterial Ig-like domain
MRAAVSALAVLPFALWFGCASGSDLGPGGAGPGGGTSSVVATSSSAATGGASASSTAASGGAATGGGGAGGSSSGGGGSGPAPQVLSTAPASGDVGVVKRPTISVTFDQAMAVATLTTNTADSACSGSLQVSRDDFATCVQMAAAPVASNGDATFAIVPAADLASATQYAVRVTTAAENAGSVPLAQPFTIASPFAVRYFHTIAIDGSLDFTSDETFSTTSTATGYVAYLAWDDTYFYAGVAGADVAANDAHKWFVLYFGGTPGSTAGVTYNTQEPTLPFLAEYHVQWRSTNDLTKGLSYSTANGWTDAGWNLSGDVFANGQYLEVRIPLANLGSPTSLAVVASMINDTSGVEATYAGVPANAFASDGYDRDFGKYFLFDLHGSTVPALYVTSP